MKDVTAKATTTAWTDTTVLISGKDGAGRKVSVELPIEALLALNAMTRQRMASSNVKRQRDRLAGPGSPVEMLGAQSVTVAQAMTIDGEIAALTFDQGTDSEISFRLSFQQAKALGGILGNLTPMVAPAADTPRLS